MCINSRVKEVSNEETLRGPADIYDRPHNGPAEKIARILFGMTQRLVWVRRILRSKKASESA